MLADARSLRIDGRNLYWIPLGQAWYMLIGRTLPQIVQKRFCDALVDLVFENVPLDVNRPGVSGDLLV